MIDIVHIDVSFKDKTRDYETYDNSRFGAIQERVVHLWSESINVSSIRMILGTITHDGIDLDERIWTGERIEEFFKPLDGILRLSLGQN